MLNFQRAILICRNYNINIKIQYQFQLFNHKPVCKYFSLSEEDFTFRNCKNRSREVYYLNSSRTARLKTLGFLNIVLAACKKLLSELASLKVEVNHIKLPGQKNSFLLLKQTLISAFAFRNLIVIELTAFQTIHTSNYKGKVKQVGYK